MERYKINIDKKDHYVSDQLITGKQIKILAGITEKDEALAKATYSHKEMGWFAYKVVKGKNPDEQILDNDGVDLIEEKHSMFFTACNGTSIVEQPSKRK